MSKGNLRFRHFSCTLLSLNVVTLDISGRMLHQTHAQQDIKHSKHQRQKPLSYCHPLSLNSVTGVHSSLSLLVYSVKLAPFSYFPISLHLLLKQPLKSQHISSCSRKHPVFHWCSICAAFNYVYALVHKAVKVDLINAVSFSYSLEHWMPHLLWRKYRITTTTKKKALGTSKPPQWTGTIKHWRVIWTSLSLTLSLSFFSKHFLNVFTTQTLLVIEIDQ